MLLLRKPIDHISSWVNLSCVTNKFYMDEAKNSEFVYTCMTVNDFVCVTNAFAAYTYWSYLPGLICYVLQSNVYGCSKIQNLHFATCMIANVCGDVCVSLSFFDE